MPSFVYRALTTQGKQAKGVVVSDSVEGAKRRLFDQGYTPLSLTPHRRGGRAHRLTPSQRLTLTEELATLLSSGMPLYESLVSIEEKHRGERTHSLYVDLCDAIRKGTPLSTALRTLQLGFPHMYTALIAAGEESGELTQVLIRLSKFTERQRRFTKQVRRALLYPAFLFSLCGGVLFALFFFLIPMLKDLFEDRPLHPVTKMLIQISDALVSHPTALLFSLLSLATTFIFLFASKKGRGVKEAICIRLPLVKKPLLQNALYQFAASLALLLEAGLPLFDALSLSEGGISLRRVRDVVSRIRSRLLEGESMSATCATSPLLPPLFTRMVALAEESGASTEMFRNLASLYEAEYEKSIQTCVALLQPALLLLLGIVVGGVVLSVLLPLTDVTSVLGASL